MTLTLKLHLALFPDRSVTEKWIWVDPSLNFMGLSLPLITGTLTRVGLNPELSEEK